MGRCLEIAGILFGSSQREVKVVKKAASSPHLSVTSELPLRPAPSANLTPHSSPAVVEPSPSSFSPPNKDLPHDPSSTFLAGKRPSDEAVFQGKEKRANAASEVSDPPKGGIPPLLFPNYDPLMAAGFFTPEFLPLPYTLLGGQQICEGTPYKSNLQSFHAVRPLLLEGLCQGYSNDADPLEVYGDMCRHLIQVANSDFELARRADNLGEENKNLKAQAPSEKVASLEEELAKPELHSDYEEFHEDYNSFWFIDLNLDAPSEDEEDEETTPSSSDAALKA
ncbi:hypothetical protein LIER_37284 [Lithospermum erythrorhizon]|uniref:Uncharacterized protein n=1 Tax=Lithospermum erythrorhizon TaxID=34254 RepID=A0AAV3PIE0_LITER